MSDLSVVGPDQVLVEIHGAPAAVAEIVAEPAAVVEIHDGQRALTVIDEPPVQVVQVVTAGPIGPRGPEGPEGPMGPFAPVFDQHFADPALIWVINHNLGVVPVVTLYDENHEEITGDIQAPDRNTIIVTFEVPFSGTARLKA